MKKTVLQLLLILMSLPGTSLADELVKVWEVGGLSKPESVIYDPSNEVLYVSNVNGPANEKDGNGFISRVSLDGEIIELNWVSGLHGPKGMALYNNNLYVADIDSLVEIDIATASIRNTYMDADARFLNDVTVSHDGKVYVSDMVTNKIHVLDNGEFVVWLEDPALENPNGLHAENNQLIVGAWGVMTEGFATDVPGHMKSVNLEDKTIQSLGNGAPLGNLDGVEPAGNDFYVTDWMAGKLYRIDREGHATLMLELGQGMADLEYIESRLLLLLPMMMNDSLLAYKVN